MRPLARAVLINAIKREVCPARPSLRERKFEERRETAAQLVRFSHSSATFIGVRNGIRVFRI